MSIFVQYFRLVSFDLIRAVWYNVYKKYFRRFIMNEDGYISDLAFYSNSEQYGYYDDENEVMLWLDFE